MDKQIDRHVDIQTNAHYINHIGKQASTKITHIN